MHRPAGIPRHVTQHGKRHERAFCEDGNYAFYLDSLADAAGRAGGEIWSYYLMPNHVHIVAAPGRALRYAHRHYICYINARLRWSGPVSNARGEERAEAWGRFILKLSHVLSN